MFAIDDSWRYLSDDDLRRWLAFYRRRLALFDEETPPGEFNEDTRAYLAVLIADAEAEDKRRDKCVPLGVPRDRPRFDDLFLSDLKRRIVLDVLCQYQLGAELGKERHGKRQGPCPICKRGENCFTVYTGDPDDQHYYCFRCGARGDCFGAVMQAHGCTFPEAVATLAGECGIPIPTGRAVARPQEDARLASLPGRMAD
jgi:hypothetical protein